MACPVYNPLSFYGDKDKTIMFKFKTFKKWGARIKSLQIGSRKADNQSATPNTPPYKNSTSGTLQAKTSANASDNTLERRVIRRDRRIDTDTNYKGPSRRFTIDRRF